MTELVLFKQEKRILRNTANQPYASETGETWNVNGFCLHVLEFLDEMCIVTNNSP